MRNIIISIIVLAIIFSGVYLLRNFTPENGNSEGAEDLELTSKSWEWVNVAYEDGTVVEPREEGAFLVTFNTDGSFGAETDCNHMGGSYVAEEGNITFSEIFQTLMYCEGSQEAEFARLLQDTTTYHFRDSGEMVLGLKFDSGTVLFK